MGLLARASSSGAPSQPLGANGLCAFVHAYSRGKTAPDSHRLPLMRYSAAVSAFNSVQAIISVSPKKRKEKAVAFFRFENSIDRYNRFSRFILSIFNARQPGHQPSPVAGLFHFLIVSGIPPVLPPLISLRYDSQLLQALSKNRLAAFIPQYLPRVVVDPVLRCLYLFRAHLREVGSLRVLSPNHNIVVLVASTLPGGIWVAEVHRRPADGLIDGAPLHLFRRRELAPVVYGDALEDLPELHRAHLPLQGIQRPDDGFGFSVRHADDDFFPGLSLRQHQQCL